MNHHHHHHQQVGTAQTLNSAETSGEGAEMEESKGAEGMDVAAEAWAEGVANQSGEEMEGVANPDSPATPIRSLSALWSFLGLTGWASSLSLFGHSVATFGSYIQSSMSIRI